MDRLTDDRDRDLAADRYDEASQRPDDAPRWASYRPDEQVEAASRGPDWALYRPSTDEPPLRDYEPVHPKGFDWRRIGRALATPFIFVGLLFWKFKFLLAALFKFKIFTTSATMLVLLIFVHEMGHVLEARRQGIKTSAPMFIPFLGALIALKELPPNAWREAQIALAGPIVGSLGAAATWGLGVALDSDLLVALAFVGFLLNLFNLLPVVPLDGGRAVAALHPALWLVGLAGLGVLTIISPNPILLIILLFGGLELWNRWQTRNDPALQSYYRIPAWQRVTVGVTYVGLAALLAVGVDLTHVERDI